MAHTIPYINFLDKSEQAASFYEAIFGGDSELQKDGNKVIQMEFTAGGIHFMGSDSEGEKSSLVLNCDSEAQLRNYYTKLVDGGKEVFAPQDSGWGALIAHCTDKFGVTWMLNFDMPEATA